MYNLLEIYLWCMNKYEGIFIVYINIEMFVLCCFDIILVRGYSFNVNRI
jgi:hypothetical protein